MFGCMAAHEAGLSPVFSRLQLQHSARQVIAAPLQEVDDLALLLHHCIGLPAAATRDRSAETWPASCSRGANQPQNLLPEGACSMNDSACYQTWTGLSSSVTAPAAMQKPGDGRAMRRLASPPQEAHVGSGVQCRLQVQVRIRQGIMLDAPQVDAGKQHGQRAFHAGDGDQLLQVAGKAEGVGPQLEHEQSHAAQGGNLHAMHNASLCLTAAYKYVQSSGNEMSQVGMSTLKLDEARGGSRWELLLHGGGLSMRMQAHQTQISILSCHGTRYEGEAARLYSAVCKLD